MLETNKEQLLSFDDVTKTRILKLIVLGIVKYTGKDKLWNVK